MNLFIAIWLAVTPCQERLNCTRLPGGNGELCATFPSWDGYSVPVPKCDLKTELKVRFLTDEKAAGMALGDGARVFKIKWPLAKEDGRGHVPWPFTPDWRVEELHRSAKTTYEVSESSVSVEGM